ncbi:MAG: hypothetical protein WDN69_19340 [Aliidongia sp.]
MPLALSHEAAAKSGARAVDRLVEHGFGEMPAGATGAPAGLHERRIKSPVMTADGDHLLLLRPIRELPRLGIGWCHRLLDEQMLAV